MAQPFFKTPFLHNYMDLTYSGFFNYTNESHYYDLTVYNKYILNYIKKFLKKFFIKEGICKFL